MVNSYRAAKRFRINFGTDIERFSIVLYVYLDVCLALNFKCCYRKIQ